MASGQSEPSPKGEESLAKSICDAEEWELVKCYEKFMEGNKDKKMTENEFKKRYAEYFPRGNSSQFTDHIFKVLKVKGDKDGPDLIDCRDVIYATILTARSPPLARDEVGWAFKMYAMNRPDGDNSYITRDDLLETFEMINSLLPEEKKQGRDAVRRDAENLFNKINIKIAGRVTLPEFRAAAKVYHMLYFIFRKAIPTGKMTKEDFMEMFESGIGGGKDASKLADHVFTAFHYGNTTKTLNYRDLFWAAVMMDLCPSDVKKLEYLKEIFGVRDFNEPVNIKETLKVFEVVARVIDGIVPQEDKRTRKKIKKTEKHLQSLIYSRDGFLGCDIPSSGVLSSEELEFFSKAIPSGQMTRAAFAELYRRKLSPDDASQTQQPAERVAAQTQFAERVFRSLNGKKDGCIDYKTFFWTAFATRQSGFQTERINCAFRLYDANGDGFIDMEEMTKMFQVVDKILPSCDRLHRGYISKAEETFKQLDKDNDGKISKEEFIEGAENYPELYEMLFQIGPVHRVQPVP